MHIKSNGRTTYSFLNIHFVWFHIHKKIHLVNADDITDRQYICTRHSWVGVRPVIIHHHQLGKNGICHKYIQIHTKMTNADVA